MEVLESGGAITDFEDGQLVVDEQCGPKKPPDSVSTDSGISSGISESEIDTELFFYDKPKQFNK